MQCLIGARSSALFFAERRSPTPNCCCRRRPAQSNLLRRKIAAPVDAFLDAMFPMTNDRIAMIVKVHVVPGWGLGDGVHENVPQACFLRLQSERKPELRQRFDSRCTGEKLTLKSIHSPSALAIMPTAAQLSVCWVCLSLRRAAVSRYSFGRSHLLARELAGFLVPTAGPIRLLLHSSSCSQPSSQVQIVLDALHLPLLSLRSDVHCSCRCFNHEGKSRSGVATSSPASHISNPHSQRQSSQ